KASERERDRILSDDEIRQLWKTADESGRLFDNYLRFVLLTATRRNEAADAKRSEFNGATWVIPAQRYKTAIDVVIPLSKPAQDVLAKMPIFKGCDYVFSTDGKHAISGFSKFKADFDERSGITGFTIHDLRRTARSLMTRADVSSEHAERCLGHVIG